jgi:hypothetical protein
MRWAARSGILSRELAAQGLYPAIDPLASTSRLIDPVHLGTQHYEVALRVGTAHCPLSTAHCKGPRPGPGALSGRGRQSAD